MEWIRRQLNAVCYLREGQDYFYIIHPFRAMAGYPVSLRTVRARLGMVLRCVCYLIYLGTLVDRLLYTLYQPEHINFMAFVSGSVGLMCAVLILMAFCSRHYECFRQLGQFINDRTFASEHPRAQAIRQRCYRWTICFIVGPQCGVVSVFLQLVLTGQLSKRHMMMVVRGEAAEWPFAHVLNVFILYMPSVCFFLACSIVNACLMGFLGEMELLAECLGELDASVERRLEEQQGGGKSRRCFWNAYHAELRRCAQRHCEIFSMVTKLQQFSSLVFLQHHFFSLTLVVSGAYVTLRANALRENPIFTEYPIPLVLLYFVFCLLVEKLQDMNNLIGERLYATRWMLQLRYSREFHREYRSAAQTIALLLWRSQQRIRFTCGAINEVSMAKFTDFINLNYTILMFFINMN